MNREGEMEAPQVRQLNAMAYGVYAKWQMNSSDLEAGTTAEKFINCM